MFYIQEENADLVHVEREGSAYCKVEEAVEAYMLR